MEWKDLARAARAGARAAVRIIISVGINFPLILIIILQFSKSDISCIVVISNSFYSLFNPKAAPDIINNGMCKTPFHHNVSGYIMKFNSMLYEAMIIPARPVTLSVAVLIFG